MDNIFSIKVNALLFILLFFCDFVAINFFARFAVFSCPRHSAAIIIIIHKDLKIMQINMIILFGKHEGETKYRTYGACFAYLLKLLPLLLES